MAPERSPAGAWRADELQKLASTDELEIASLRADGTLTRPVTIWVVAHAGDLYVRSWKGAGAAWFKAAKVRHEGRISTAGFEKDVRFQPAAGEVDGEIDAAFRSKYGRYGGGYVDEMIAPEARATTPKLVPRPPG